MENQSPAINLSATIEKPLAAHVAEQQAESCIADWNAVHDAIGSFADEHSTL